MCHALGAPRENTKEGVRAALRAGESRGALNTAVLWQPAFFPHALPFRYSLPAFHDSDVDFREPNEIPVGDAPGKRAVVVVTSKTEPVGPRAYPGLWDSIRRGRRLADTLPIDAATRVYVYEPRGSTPTDSQELCAKNRLPRFPSGPTADPARPG